MGFCSNCGSPFYEEDKFCQSCGASLEDIHKEVASVLVNGTVSSNTNRKKILLGLVAVILMGSAGYLGWNWMESKNADSRLTETANRTSGTKIWNQQSEESSNGVTSGVKIKTTEESSASTSIQGEEKKESVSQLNSEATSGMKITPVSEEKQPDNVDTASQEDVSVVESASEVTVIKSLNGGASENSNSVTVGSTGGNSLISTQQIHQLFNNYFGSIYGSHSLYFKDLTNENQEFVSSEALVVNDVVIRSASTIKLFVLAALYDMSDKGEISLDTVHYLKSNDKVEGTGDIQYSANGTPYSLRSLAREMIVNSDNTAMNIIVDYIGMDNVNRYITGLGYKLSSLNRKMLDYSALNRGIDNYISAREAGEFMSRLYSKKLVSPSADQEMLHILSQQEDIYNLEYNLPSSVVTYNKTGQFSTYGVKNDVSIVSTHKGTYVLVVLSQDGDESAQVAAMRSFGEAVYQTYINQKTKGE